MNDFEDKLRRTPLRTPPPEWRAEIAADGHPGHSWRQEVWPSLSTWAALAAVWLVLIVVERFTSPPTPVQSPARIVALEPLPPDSLLAFHTALKSADAHNPFR